LDEFCLFSDFSSFSLPSKLWRNSEGDEYKFFFSLEIIFSFIDNLFFDNAVEISEFMELIVDVNMLKNDIVELNFDSKEEYDSSLDLSLFRKSFINVHKLLF